MFETFKKFWTNGSAALKLPEQLDHQYDLSFTPDIAKLEELEAHWMFVCDEAMPNHHMSWLMDPEQPRGEAFTARPDFILWKKYLGLKTVAVPMTADHNSYIKNMKLNGEPMYPAARLKGHLYLIKPKHFIELDTYKQNGVVFQRQRIDLLVPYSVLEGDDLLLTERVQFLQAWVYMGNYDFWNNYTGAQALFNPSNPIKARKLGKTDMPHYYHFGQKDYQIEKATKPAIIHGEADSTTHTVP